MRACLGLIRRARVYIYADESFFAWERESLIVSEWGSHRGCVCFAAQKSARYFGMRGFGFGATCMVMSWVFAVCWRASGDAAVGSI